MSQPPPATHPILKPPQLWLEIILFFAKKLLSGIKVTKSILMHSPETDAAATSLYPSENSHRSLHKSCEQGFTNITTPWKTSQVNASWMDKSKFLCYSQVWATLLFPEIPTFMSPFHRWHKPHSQELWVPLGIHLSQGIACWSAPDLSTH